jgi:hypothetical protein
VHDDARNEEMSVSITFQPLNEADPAGVRDLLVGTVWKRDWSEDVAENFFSWRYRARESGDTLVASDQGRCVGVLDSFTRPYWIAGRQQMVRETCDWFCLPEYRSFGVGLHLMRRMMAKPEPIVVIGGTAYTRSLLPRLKWAQLPDVGNFLLGVSARTVAGLAAHKRWRAGIGLARFVPNIPLLRRIPQHPAPAANCEVRLRVLGETAETGARAPYAVAPALSTRALDWLAHAPAVLGQFVQLSFYCDGELVGLSISRLEELPSCGRLAKIVHLHAARLETIDWMLGVTVNHLVEQGAGAILSRASCPATASSLSGLGFWRLNASPVYWWPAKALPPAGLLNLTALQADDALQFT